MGETILWYVSDDVKESIGSVHNIVFYETLNNNGLKMFFESGYTE